MNLITTQGTTRDDAERYLVRADHLRAHPNPANLGGVTGRTVACIFYEPSTRTSSSFIAAAGKLGMNVIPITQGVQFSSVSKGESLEDTILTLAQYADTIVLRHPETGAAARAAAVSPVPIINAGDGIGEHPTQALLDLYTIQREFGRTDNLHITFVGDLFHGRTIHSLLRLLRLYPGNTFSLVSPALLALDRVDGSMMPPNTESTIVRKSLSEARAELEKADVVYMTRVQKERFVYDSGYQEVKDSCLLTPELVACMKPEARILHPLPRVNEIPTSIDADPRAAYFRQVHNGLWLRMAVLTMLLPRLDAGLQCQEGHTPGVEHGGLGHSGDVVPVGGTGVPGQRPLIFVGEEPTKREQQALPHRVRDGHQGARLTRSPGVLLERTGGDQPSPAAEDAVPVLDLLPRHGRVDVAGLVAPPEQEPPVQAIRGAHDELVLR